MGFPEKEICCAALQFLTHFLVYTAIQREGAQERISLRCIAAASYKDCIQLAYPYNDEWSFDTIQNCTEDCQLAGILPYLQASLKIVHYWTTKNHFQG